MRKILYIAAVVLLAAGCDKQRDLYGVSHPMLYIEGDWMPSLGQADMTSSATALLFGERGDVTKEFFYDPNSVTVKVVRGDYGILLFNGLMYSPDDTYLDNVRFRGEDRLDTFEAYALQGAVNARIGKSGGEYIASNEMEILTSACEYRYVDADNGYYLKYKNGRNGYPVVPDYVEQSLRMTPVAVSYNTQVTVNLVNPSSVGGASGELRGFVGSVLMATRQPSHMDVIHQFRVNNLTVTDEGTEGDPDDPELGFIASEVFVTFGPPIDLPERKYEFRLVVALVDDTTFDQTFDITDQVLPVIDLIKANLDATQPVTLDVTIPLEIDVTLPKVEPIGGSIDVGRWGDDEVIKVPIR